MAICIGKLGVFRESGRTQKLSSLRKVLVLAYCRHMNHSSRCDLHLNLAEYMCGTITEQITESGGPPPSNLFGGIEFLWAV